MYHFTMSTATSSEASSDPAIAGNQTVVGAFCSKGTFLRLYEGI